MYFENNYFRGSKTQLRVMLFDALLYLNYTEIYL